MDIKTDGIGEIYNILKQNNFDKKAFNNFCKTRVGKEFLIHEKSRDKRVDKSTVKEELKRLILDEKHEDRYEFYRIKRNLSQLKKDLNYIENNKNMIIEKALKEVYKIVPRHMGIKAKIYLYAGGMDGGFTLDRRKIFINYGKYIGKIDDFIKILSHELYHSRYIRLENRIKYLLRILLNSSELAIYQTIGKSIEEGLACLVQHGHFLKEDDLVNGLTNRKLLLRKREFDLLNDILLSVKDNNICHEKTSKINNYIIGYHMVSTIYNSEGVLILDYWTENLEYKQIIKKYIEICNESNMKTGFTGEIEKWLLWR